MRNSQFSSPLLHDAIEIMTPFLLAAIGGLFTELSGMLNIALEGLMLAGAFFSVIFAATTGNLFLGILLGILCTMLLSLFFGMITIHLKANVFITGLATNLFASGFTVVLAFQLFGTKGVIQFPNIPRLPVLTVPDSLQRIPFVQDTFWHASAGHGHEQADYRFLGLEPGAVSACGYTHFRVYLCACRLDAHYPAGGICP